MKRPWRAVFAAAVSLIAVWVVLMLPGTVKLRPHYRRTTLDGVTTLDDAVEACRRTGLRGWELVAYAQQLVARKFSIYCARNLWDTPARAFEYGLGYCTQYNLALKQILDRLGFDVEAVFARKVRVLTEPDWTMGHTWLRVTVQAEVREVCAGRCDNSPGYVHFEAVTPVQHGSKAVLMLMNLGMLPFCGFVEWRALFSGKGDPGWTFQQKHS